MPYTDALSLHPALLITAATLLGLLIGSFLNVVIHRLPRMLQRDWQLQCQELMSDTPLPNDVAPYNLAVPASHCPHCGTTIPPWRNIPVVSYLLQRGRCHHCGVGINPRYPLVEALTALLSGLLAWHFGLGWPLLGALLFTYALLALIFIDLDHQLLPDQLTLPLLWLGLVFNLHQHYTDTASAIYGAIAGYLTLWLIYHAYRLLTAKQGFGYGDFKLLAALGAWLGWQLLPLVVLLASVTGTLAGIGLIVARRHRREQPLAFGPYLAIAGLIALLWGDAIMTAYFHFSGLA